MSQVTVNDNEACVVEMAAAVKERLGPLDPKFIRASEAMLEWVKLWKAITTCSSS